MIIVTIPNPGRLLTLSKKAMEHHWFDQDRLRMCATGRAKCFQNMTCPPLQTSISRSVRLQFLMRYSKPAVTSFFWWALNKICFLTLSCHYFFLWNNFISPKWDSNLPNQKNQMVCHPPQGLHSKNFWLPIQPVRHTIVQLWSAGHWYGGAGAAFNFFKVVVVSCAASWDCWKKTQLPVYMLRRDMFQVKPHAFVYIRIQIHLIIDTIYINICSDSGHMKGIHPLWGIMKTTTHKKTS